MILLKRNSVFTIVSSNDEGPLQLLPFTHSEEGEWRQVAPKQWIVALYEGVLVWIDLDFLEVSELVNDKE